MARHPVAAAAMAAAASLVLSLQGCTRPKVVDCSPDAANCRKTGCCLNKAHKCWMKSDGWAECIAECKDFTCTEVKPGGKINTTTTTTKAYTPPKSTWYEGSWTTGYWDCCKPSCSWPGKGEQQSPILACDGKTDKPLNDANVHSVCEGGTAATCSNNAPFKVTETLSMGFAAVSGKSPRLHLSGDLNCGQCFEAIFADTQHVDPSGFIWGGSNPKLVGKRMVLQVSNFGTDVSGNHSFDILIPGAGQGIFHGGCVQQFPKYEVDDFDCGKRHGGCDKEADCDKLPKSLQEGCRWRYTWLQWKNGGQTNNPYIKFRRVRCPRQLSEISGVALFDDDRFPEVNQDDGTAEIVS